MCEYLVLSQEAWPLPMDICLYTHPAPEVCEEGEAGAGQEQQLHRGHAQLRLLAATGGSSWDWLQAGLGLTSRAGCAAGSGGWLPGWRPWCCPAGWSKEGRDSYLILRVELLKKQGRAISANL